jgi:hypothetical protein
VKFYIQDSQTAEFIRCDSTWSADLNEALDFLSERRAFFFGMKELGNSFQILKVASGAPLPMFIPQLIRSDSSQTRLVGPDSAAKYLYQQAPLMPWVQSSVLGMRVRFSRLGEVSRLNLF